MFNVRWWSWRWRHCTIFIRFCAVQFPRHSIIFCANIFHQSNDRRYCCRYYYIVIVIVVVVVYGKKCCKWFLLFVLVFFFFSYFSSLHHAIAACRWFAVALLWFDFIEKWIFPQQNVIILQNYNFHCVWDCACEPILWFATHYKDSRCSHESFAIGAEHTLEFWDAENLN